MNKIVALLLLCTALFAQQKGTFTDTRDGKVYKTTKIGEQVWMAENLNYQTKGGSWCYKDSISYCKQYGRLYDWKTAKTACPADYHLPSNEEWTALVNYIGGQKTVGKKLKSKVGWNKNGNGTDGYGFSALPGGCRFPKGYLDAGNVASWWAATEEDDDYDTAYTWVIYNFEDGVFRFGIYKSNRLSVRCVADNP